MPTDIVPNKAILSHGKKSDGLGPILRAQYIYIQKIHY